VDEKTVRRLVELNARFYEDLAAPFSASRAGPQPGYERLVNYFPPPPLRVLDVGCGNGRFARFLLGRGLPFDYTGVDFSPSLLEQAFGIPGQFVQSDLSQVNALDGLDDYDLIVCLSTLQHIPGHTNRQRLLSEIARHLAAAGRIITANWQFLRSERQRRKIRPWAEAGIDPARVETDDYLLSWERSGSGLRYAAHLDETVTRELAAAAELTIVEQFLSDGREGDLNLYTIMTRQ
jgi:SAM-dependent methyltransferase